MQWGLSINIPWIYVHQKVLDVFTYFKVELLQLHSLDSCLPERPLCTHIFQCVPLQQPSEVESDQRHFMDFCLVHLEV